MSRGGTNNRRNCADTLFTKDCKGNSTRLRKQRVVVAASVVALGLTMLWDRPVNAGTNQGWVLGTSGNTSATATSGGGTGLWDTGANWSSGFAPSNSSAGSTDITNGGTVIINFTGTENTYGDVTTADENNTARTGGSGTYQMSSGTLDIGAGAAGWFKIAYGVNSSGTFNMTGGTVNLSSGDNFFVGSASGSSGRVLLGPGATFNLTGGSSTFTLGDTSVSAGSTGLLSITGGTFNNNSTKGYASIALTGCTGYMNVSAGSYNTTGDDLNVADGGSGTNATLNVSGTGTVSVGGKYIYVGKTSGSTGTINANGGNISAGAITGYAYNALTTSTSTLNLNGGMLSSTTTGSSSSGEGGNFIYGFAHANVLAGGAIINSNGHTFGINQVLLNGTGGGVDGGLTVIGNGVVSLLATSTYTGVTTVNSASLRAASDGMLGADPGSLVANNITLINGELTSDSTTALNLNAFRGITMTGTGYFDPGFGPGSPFNGTGTVGAVIVNGPITGSANLAVVWDSSTLTLNGSDSYTGSTIIGSTGNNNYYYNNAVASPTLQLGTNNANAIPAGSPLVFNQHPNQTTVTQTLDLNGNTPSFGPISSAVGTNAIIDNSSSNPATLNMGVGGTAGVVTTYAGVIRNSVGNMSVTQSGPNTQVLAGSNTYNGNTNVAAGVLSITGSVNNSPVYIVGGTLAGTGTIGQLVSLNTGNLNPGLLGAGSVGTLTLNGGLTVNGGNLGFDLTSNTSNSDAIVISGTLTFNGAGTLTAAGGSPGSVYTLATASSITGAVPILVQPTGTARVGYAWDSSSYSATNNTATSLVIDVNGAVGNLTWNNTAGGNGTSWDIVGQLNWASSASAGNPNQFYQGDNVTFNDSNNGKYSVNVTTNVTPASVTVNTNGAYVFSGTGSITGVTGLVMSSGSGTGSLTINNSNTFSGGTTLNSGTISANSTAALGTGPVTVNGGQLNLNNAAALSSAMLTLNGGTLDNTTGSAITLSTATPQTWAGSFIFIGTQNLNLGTGPVTLSNANVSNITVTVNNSNAVLTVPGSISGSVSLTKAGLGTLFLSGTNSGFSGGVTINAGTVEVTSPGGGVLPLGTALTTVNTGGTLLGAAGDAFGYSNPPGIFINGGTVTDLPGTSYRITLPNLTFMGGTLTSGAGNLGDGSGNYSLFGNGTSCTITTNAANTTAVINASAISPQEPTTFNVAQGTTPSGVDLLISSVIENFGTQPLTFNGPGVTQLSGGSTYTGVTNINGGTLLLSSLANGGTASNIGKSTNAATNLVLNGGTLMYTGPAASTDRLFTLGGNFTIDSSGTGPVNFTNTGATVVSNGGTTLTLQGSNTGRNTLAASIPDNGGTSITKNGTGTWVLSGSSTYQGTTTINQGSLILTGSIQSAVSINGGNLYGTGGTSNTVTLNGGTIDPGASGPLSVGTLTFSGLNVTGGTDNMNFDLSNGSNDQIVVNGQVSLNSASSIAPTGGVAGSSYTIINASNGSITGSVLPTIVQPSTSRAIYLYDPASYNPNSNPSAKSLIIDYETGTNATLTWNNSGLSGDGITWDVIGQKNWTSTAPTNPNQFFQGDNVIFNDNNNGHYNVSLNTFVTPASVTVNTNGAYTISGNGSIGSLATLTMSSNSGTGSLTISIANSFTGGTQLNSGTLNANSPAALGTGPVTVNAGTLNINNAAALSTAALTLNGGTLDNTSAAPITLSTVTPQTWAGNFTFTGTQNLNTGSGVITLANANTTPNVTVTVTNPNAVLDIAGVIAGTGQTLTKAGPGTLLLTGNNTFSGGVVVNAGTLEVTGNGANSGLNQLNTSVIVNTSATLIGANGDAFGYNNAAPGAQVISINGGTVTNIGTSSYRITLPDLSFTGGLLTSNAANIGDLNGQYSFFGGAVQTVGAPTTAVINAPVITIQDQNQSGTNVLFMVAAGNVSGGTYPGVDLYVSSSLLNFGNQTNGLTKAGAGVMELAGSNNYSNGTLVSAGTLVIGVNAALPTGRSVVVQTGGTLVLPDQAAVAVPSTLNISGNLIVHGGTLASLNTSVATGYSGGAWTGAGIASAAAAADTTSLTALGVIQNSTSQSAAGPVLYTTFEGQHTVDTDVLVKYTYYGDTDLNGEVDGSDYSRVDNAYFHNQTTTLAPLTGWFNGDFNYDGVVDGSDYTLMDNACNNQGAQISTQLASPTAQIGGNSAVPEPASLGLLAVGTLSRLGRRTPRRHRR